MVDSFALSMSFHQQLRGRFTQEFDYAIDAFAVQFPANFPVESLGGAIDRDEADKLLEPGQRLFGAPHQAEVEPEASVVAGIRPGGTVEVVNDDRRVATDQA